jgi:hypothetical protein
MKRKETCVILTPLSSHNEDMRDDSCEKGDRWKLPSPTSCSDSTVGGTVIASTEGDRHLYCTSERWDDAWTLEAPLQQRPVAVMQIPLKQGRSRLDEYNLGQMRTLKRQKTRFSSMLLDFSIAEQEPAIKRCKKIRFKETVDVMPVPMRSEYTLEMRCNVWSSSREIQENAARNTIEFAHDGWDWRKVADEELFQECHDSGTWIHPVHCT